MQFRSICTFHRLEANNDKRSDLELFVSSNKRVESGGIIIEVFKTPPQARRRTIGPACLSFEPGVESAAASAGGDGGPEQGFDGDMAPVDLDQAMGSFSPEWANDTVRTGTYSDVCTGVR